MYRDIFGADNVLALPLALMKNDPDHFAQRLFSFLDLPIQHPVTSQKSNAGWGALTVELYRLTNGLVRSNPLGGPVSLPFRIRAALTRRLDQVIPHSWHKRAEKRKRNALQARIGDYFLESNSRLARMTAIDLQRLGYVRKPSAGGSTQSLTCLDEWDFNPAIR